RRRGRAAARSRERASHRSHDPDHLRGGRGAEARAARSGLALGRPADGALGPRRRRPGVVPRQAAVGSVRARGGARLVMGVLLSRLDARDRALFSRWSLAMQPMPRVRSLKLWRAVTHCGGVRVSVSAALIPLAIGAPGGALRLAALQAAIALTASHLCIQLVKRFVGRPRPSSKTGCATLIDEPACFSFPSGHATAAMSVAFAYALAFPSLALWSLMAAATVGFSRARLGVHYPGDVLAGPLI